MYDNIGGKIKGLAQGVFIFEAASAVISGIVLLVDELIGIGLLTLFGGPVVAWVSSWLLYGFGELICETSQAKKELININRNIKIIAEPMIAQKEEADRQARKKAAEIARHKTAETVREEFDEKAQHEATEKTTELLQIIDNKNNKNNGYYKFKVMFDENSISKCDLCGNKETQGACCRIDDDKGTKYVHLCTDCLAKHK